TSRKAGVWRVHTAAEYRLLSDRPGLRVGHLNLDVRSEGNLLVTGANPGGLRLWDLRFQRQVAQVPNPDGDTALFHAPSQSLLGCGRRGIYRWPMKLVLSEQRLRIGPPEKMYPKILDRPGCPNLSGDGRFLAVVLDGRSVRVLNLEHEA